MAGQPLSAAQLRATVAAVKKRGDLTGAAEVLNVSRSTVLHRWREAIRRGFAEKGDLPSSPEHFRDKKVKGRRLDGPPEQKVSDAVNAESGERTIEADGHRLRTVDDVLKHAGVSTAEWRVRSVRVNSWEGFYKDDDGNHHVVPMFQVRVDLKAKKITDPDVVRDTMIEAMKKWAPAYGVPPSRRGATLPPRGRGERDRKGGERGILLEIAVPDLHIGKLAWAPETGERYDSRLATDVYRTCTEALLEQAIRGWGDRIGRILLPIGNDLLHVDSAENTTTSGTRVDADTRHQKSFRMAVEMLVASIERLATVAPVTVCVVPGNHDRQRAFYVGECVQAWFHRHSRVEVDNAPTLRKYVRFGVNLIMLTHGSDEKGRDLAQIMAHERPAEWAASTTREVHLGHWHTRREVRHTAGDTHHGVAERILPSLSGTDAWHAQKGYIGGPKEATALVYDRAGGYVGQFVSRPNKRAYR